MDNIRHLPTVSAAVSTISGRIRSGNTMGGKTIRSMEENKETFYTQ